MMRDVVDPLLRFLFTQTSLKRFVRAKEGLISSGCSPEQRDLPCSSSPGSAALRACQTVFSFPKLEVVCANSKFPG